MPKRYKGAHFLRRIRRPIEAQGYTLELRFVESIINDNQMLETILSENGSSESYLAHRWVGKGAWDQNFIDSMITAITTHKGLTQSEIDQVRSRFGLCINDNSPFRIEVRHGVRPLFHQYATFIDVLGREVDQIVMLPLAGESSFYGDLEVEATFQTMLDLTAKRRGKNGSSKPILIGPLFANFLRSRQDAIKIIPQIIPMLKNVYEEQSKSWDGDEITIDRITTGMPNKGLKWEISGRNIHLTYSTDALWSIEKDTLIVHADIPETMIVRLVGAKIGDAFSGLPFDPDLRILSAKSRKRPKGSIALKLKGKPISPESLLLEINSKL